MSDVQRRSYSPNIAKENLLNVCLALVTELRGFMPACPARLRLLSGSCSSAHSFAPRFLHAGLTERRSAVCFARYDQLAGGLPPPSRRPCWAHMKEAANWGGLFLLDCSRVRKLTFASSVGPAPLIGSPCTGRSYWPRKFNAARPAPVDSDQIGTGSLG